MPRYFFHIDNSVHVSDPAGMPLHDDRAAKEFAEFVAGNLSRAEQHGRVKVRVTDERGREVCRVHRGEMPARPH